MAADRDTSVGPATGRQAEPGAIAEWRRGGGVVGAAVTGMMVASLHSYSLGVMVGPLEREFGWSRASISAGTLLCSVVSVIFSPLFGVLIDRFGPRRIGLLGVASYCTALGLLATAGPSMAGWLALWSLLAIALLNTKPTVWLAAVTSMFDRSRGLALAVVLSATGISQAVTPAITFALVGAFGWRLAYVGLAAGAAAISLPVLWIWFTSARDQHRTSRTRVLDEPGLGRREGLLSRTFLQLAIGALAMSIAGATLTVNLVPILTSLGMDTGMAVALASLSGLSAIAGRVIGGVLLDRFNARIVGGIAVLMPISTCVILLWFPGNLAAVAAGVVLNGLASGAEMDAIAYLAGRSFGMRNFGLLFGSLSGLLALGVGLGPTLANYVFDVSGTYRLALAVVIPLCMVTSAMFVAIPRYPELK